MTNVQSPAVQPQTSEGHDWLSSAYVDDWVGDWSARTERPEQLRRVAVALPFPREQPLRVLDVGGGWGPLTEQVLAYRPSAKVTLVDFSQPMLDHASARFSAANLDVELAQRDLTDTGWTSGLGQGFDAVVSSLAIHNLQEPEVIGRVYADIFGLVREGGCFLNLEILYSTGPRLGAIARRFRAEDRGEDPDSIALPESAKRGAGEPPLPVPSRSLEAQLQWLRGAGFGEVDCLWRSGNLALLAALR